MKRTLMPVLLAMTLLGASCRSDSDPAPTPTAGVLLNTTFAESRNGWEGDYTDYDVAQEALIEFAFAHTGLPQPLNTAQKALRLYGRNRSDDLFMFVRRQLTGLAPNREYRLVFEVEMAAKYPENSIGIGGSPGSSVYLKAGASATKPEKVKDGTYYKLSVDKGAQSNAGPDAVVLGNVANGKDVEEYALFQRSNQHQPFTARTNAKGELWVYIGTDSGFEGDQALYYSRIKVTAL